MNKIKLDFEWLGVDGWVDEWSKTWFKGLLNAVYKLILF
jgi:hypothetical protein